MQRYPAICFPSFPCRRYFPSVHPFSAVRYPTCLASRVVLPWTDVNRSDVDLIVSSFNKGLGTSSLVFILINAEPPQSSAFVEQNNNVSNANVARQQQTRPPHKIFFARFDRRHPQASMQGLRPMSIEEEQMRWIQSMLSVQG